MDVTPSEIIALAVARHRQPWNWTFHLASVFGFALAMLMQSFLVFAVSLIFLAVGFFALGLKDMPEGRWLGFVMRAVEWEKDWLAYPWTFRKSFRFAVFLILCGVTVWGLWTADVAVLGLLVGGGVLVKIMAENKANGIDP